MRLTKGGKICVLQPSLFSLRCRFVLLWTRRVQRKRSSKSVWVRTPTWRTSKSASIIESRSLRSRFPKCVNDIEVNRTGRSKTTARRSIGGIERNNLRLLKLGRKAFRLRKGWNNLRGNRKRSADGFMLKEVEGYVALRSGAWQLRIIRHNKIRKFRLCCIYFLAKATETCNFFPLNTHFLVEYSENGRTFAQLSRLCFSWLIASPLNSPGTFSKLFWIASLLLLSATRHSQ